MKNIVVLSDFYYPDMGAVSAVVDKYIQGMKGNYCFHVITVSWFTEFKQLDDPYIKVHYISCFWHKLRSIAESRYRNNANLINRLLISLLRLRTFFLFSISLSPNKWEIKEYYKKLEELNSKMKIDAVLSVSGNIYAHLSAKNFKKRHSDIRWITIVLDPYTFCVNTYSPLLFKKSSKKKMYKDEMDIYSNADYNCILESLYESVIKEFHQPTNKTYSLRFALTDIRSNHKKMRKSKEHEKIRLIYAGRLYPIIRNPDFMLSQISKIDFLSLDMFIFQHNCDDIVNKYVSDRIKLYGAVDREAYEEKICNDYDILVNIGNNSPNQLPSKMLELLSTGRPIINFYYFKDSQYYLIDKYPLGINIGRDDQDALTKLELFCKNMKGKQLSFEDVENLYPEHSLREQVNILDKLINA